jgi:uncharacterized membrane protein
MTQDTSSNEKRLKLMRFWLVGTFVIIFAASAMFSGYIGSAAGDPIGGMLSSWPVWVIAAVLCIGAYFGYKSFINRQQ